MELEDFMAGQVKNGIFFFFFSMLVSIQSIFSHQDCYTLMEECRHSIHHHHHAEDDAVCMTESRRYSCSTPPLHYKHFEKRKNPLGTNITALMILECIEAGPSLFSLRKN